MLRMKLERDAYISLRTIGPFNLYRRSVFTPFSAHAVSFGPDYMQEKAAPFTVYTGPLDFFHPFTPQAGPLKGPLKPVT